MKRGKREAVTCHLCGIVWAAPAGYGRKSYHSHYVESHFELEAERVKL